MDNKVPVTSHLFSELLVTQAPQRPPDSTWDSHIFGLESGVRKRGYNVFFSSPTHNVRSFDVFMSCAQCVGPMEVV